MTSKVLFHRSAETISRTIRTVLCSTLKLHHILFSQSQLPSPITSPILDGSISRLVIWFPSNVR
ncbi:hypothetical protein LINPERPRIM_LOCUS7275 [Linum perenne]